MDGLKKYNSFGELSGQSGSIDNATPPEVRQPRNFQKEAQKVSGTIFSPILKKLYPKSYPKGKEIKSIDEKKVKLSKNESVDRMGIVIDKKDLELQDEVYTEVDQWRDELSKITGNNKIDGRNKRELEIFEENPYEWVKIALDKKIDRINKKDLGVIEKSNRKQALEEKINAKRPLVERLNNIKLAIDRKIPLEINGEMRSDWILLENGKTLDVEVATDEINKIYNKESLNYSVVGVIFRGREKFVVLRDEIGERVELKMEDAERLAEETSIDFIKAKKKGEKLEGIQINDVIKIRIGGLEGKRSSYKIKGVEKGRIFFEDLATNQKGSMSIEDMRAFLMDKNKEFVVEKSAEYKNREELKGLEYFNEKIEELKIQQTIGRRKASPEEKVKLWKEQLAELGFGNIEIELAGQVEDTEGIEEQNQEKAERLEIMRRIGDILKKNNLKLDRVVIHGYSYENKEGELMSHWDVDSDTRGALYMLHLAGIRTNEIEKTHKGTEIEPKTGETMMYIDTSSKTLGIENKNAGKQIIMDHHQKEYMERKTSATKELYETLLENNLIKREPWIDKLVDCINQEDNLSYVDDKRFNEKYFKYKYASSLFALQKEVDFHQLVKWCREGKDLFDPKFTDKELDEEVKTTIEVEGWEDENGKKSKAYENAMVPLRSIIAKIQERIDNDFKAFDFAKKKMKERGIKKYTKELGNILYNLPDFQNFIGKNKGKVVNKFNYPFLVTRAMGGDTYISYSELNKKYFINSSTYDLTFIDKELSKKIPEGIMVNGVMILPPKKKAEREVINEEEFLKIIKLKE